MRRAAFAALALAGCGVPTPEVALRIRLPADHHLLAATSRLELSAERDGRVIAQASFAGDASYLSVAGVSYGPRTLLALDGLTASGDVVGRGRSCAFDFLAGGGNPAVDLYFAPTNFFAPTAGAPAVERADAVAMPLATGAVLIVGGAGKAGPLPTAELYAPGPSTFSPLVPELNHARARAVTTAASGIGALITGGVDDHGLALSDAEVFLDARQEFLPLQNQALGARVGHSAVALPDGRVLIAGGGPAGAAPLPSTALVTLRPDGTATVAPGPALSAARRQHAAVVAAGVAVLTGGYGSDGKPLASIEALVQGDTMTPPAFVTIAQLRRARAEATATVLDDGSILIVGGAADASGSPLGDAELYNPITRTTTVYPLGFARRGHTATLLPGGRVLIAGGTGGAGTPLSSVELFAAGVGFVSERALGTARAHHAAIPLCDGTVLVVGGAPGAELYNPPSR